MWALKDCLSSSATRGSELASSVATAREKRRSSRFSPVSRVRQPAAPKFMAVVRTWLEVGTGFHPELTGRENMYLSGAILGMSKREIERNLTPLFPFPEWERFIDTQLKHYSTGMQMRLAFAVAAHLEPDILLVDEVLAVGDLEFQRNCLGKKMEEVSGSGRTILFVSHQMNQIRRLCKRVLWFEGGEIYRSGSTAAVLGEYEAALSSGQRNQNQRSTGTQTKARFVRWQIDGTESGSSNFLTTMGVVTVHFQVEAFASIQNGHHGIALYNGERQLMWAWAKESVHLEPGVHEFSYTFPTLPLRPGPYSWQVSLWENGKVLDMWDCVPDMIITTEGHQHRRMHGMVF